MVRRLGWRIKASLSYIAGPVANFCLFELHIYLAQYACKLPRDRSHQWLLFTLLSAALITATACLFLYRVTDTWVLPCVSCCRVTSARKFRTLQITNIYYLMGVCQQMLKSHPAPKPADSRALIVSFWTQKWPGPGASETVHYFLLDLNLMDSFHQTGISPFSSCFSRWLWKILSRNTAFYIQFSPI